jgi:hypothetical protein
VAARDAAQKRRVIPMPISSLQRYRWEALHLGAICGVIIVLIVVTHLPGHTDSEDRPIPSWTPTLASGGKEAATHPSPRSRAPPSDPREVVVGPNSISGQFTLLDIDRKRSTPETDVLTLRLHVVSRAIVPLVTPFESAMLDVHAKGLEPINPQHPFSHPVPAGESRNEDIAFMIPSNLTLDRMALRIHYYNEEKEIPLNSFSRVLPREANSRTIEKSVE